MRAFQLLHGCHIQNDLDGKERLYNSQEPGNNVVESEKDLVKLFGGGKFRELSAGTAVADVLPPSTTSVQATDIEKELQAMSIKQLQKFAEEEEIPLKGATRKEEIIKIILENT